MCFTQPYSWSDMSGGTSIQPDLNPAKLTLAEQPSHHLDVFISSSLIKAWLCFICITPGWREQDIFPLSSQFKPWCSGQAAPAPGAEGVGGWSWAGEALGSSRNYSLKDLSVFVPCSSVIDWFRCYNCITPPSPFHFPFCSFHPSSVLNLCKFCCKGNSE